MAQMDPTNGPNGPYERWFWGAKTCERTFSSRVRAFSVFPIRLDASPPLVSFEPSRPGLADYPRHVRHPDGRFATRTRARLGTWPDRRTKRAAYRKASSPRAAPAPQARVSANQVPEALAATDSGRSHRAADLERASSATEQPPFYHATPSRRDWCVVPPRKKGPAPQFDEAGPAAERW